MQRRALALAVSSLRRGGDCWREALGSDTALRRLSSASQLTDAADWRTKYDIPSSSAHVGLSRSERDVVIIGGGHNGLIAAAYLAKAGLDVLVLERRPIVGGAAVTEELVPGFKFSRASYLAGLLRPQIIEDLALHKYGFEYLVRDPSSFTPTLPSSRWGGKSLLLGASDEGKDWESIAQFSEKDADAFVEYEAFLSRVREIITPLLDDPLPNPFEGSARSRARAAGTLSRLAALSWRHRASLAPFAELLTAPASHVLDRRAQEQPSPSLFRSSAAQRWFENDVLKATLATDAVIGAMASPRTPGSAYVLLHHVMGEVEGRQGTWAYVKGGMGALTQCVASAARDAGAGIATSACVSEVLTDASGTRATGVRLLSGEVVTARKAVVANCTPFHLFAELMAGSPAVPAWLDRHVRHADYSCGAFKINCAVDKLPQYLCMGGNSSSRGGNSRPGPEHRGTAHFETTVQEIHAAYEQASQGVPAARPVVELTIPSALDGSIAPEGKHVVQLFVQYAPYDVDPSVGSWADPAFKEAFVERCFGVVEEHAPGFRASVLGYDALSPLDLERVFGLHRGNIFHGAISLHQLAYLRPAAGMASHRTPVKGLYLGGSGVHPGGGVMGAPGRNVATIIRDDLL